MTTADNPELFDPLATVPGVNHLDPGIHYGVPAQRYHADPAARPSLSRSLACTLLDRSPMHAWYEHPRLGAAKRAEHSDPDDRQEHDHARARGTLLHAMLLGADADRIEVVPFANFRTKEAQKLRRDAITAAGKTPVTKAQYERAEKRRSRMREALNAVGCNLDACDTEVTCVWVAPGGVLCRCRFDALDICETEATIWDLKTCESCALKDVRRGFVDQGLDVQHAAYVQALETAIPELAGRVRMRFAYLERDWPHLAADHAVTGAMRELGERRWKRACNTWAECIESGTWPGPEGGLIDARPWEMEDA